MIQTSPREAARLVSDQIQRRVQERRDQISRLRDAGLLRGDANHLSNDELRRLSEQLAS